MNVAADLDRRAESLRFLLRDRDGEYRQSFDGVYGAEDMEILKSVPRVRECRKIIRRAHTLDHGSRAVRGDAARTRTVRVDRGGTPSPWSCWP